MNNIDPNATKYMIKAKINADGIVEKPDVVGAIFGQTEGLLGDELELRDLQKSGRIGRIEVEITAKGGKSDGTIFMSTSLDQVETVILASALETVDRVGPCKASIHVLGIEDVRITKREKVVERAKELLTELMKQSKGSSDGLTQNVRQSVQIEEITTYGVDRCPAGPSVKDAEAIIIVEGRSDVLNLLKAGIKNAIAVEGTNVPKTVADLSRERVATAFVDGDRGGELILKELSQVADVDFVARAPRAHEVEELTAKQIGKCLKNKIPWDQYMEMNGLTVQNPSSDEDQPASEYESRRDDRRDNRHEDRRDNDRNRHDRNRDRHDRRDNDRNRDRDERREKKRFDNDRIDSFRKREDGPAIEEYSEGPAVEPIAEPEERYEEPAPQIDIEELVPAVSEPEVEQVEEKPKKARTLKGKKDSKKNLSPEQEKYASMLSELSATHNAKILGEDFAIIREVAVKSLVKSLESDSEGAVAIVFDGVISQRILDVSAKNGIKTIVGTRKGNISKMPADITTWIKEDLCR